MPSISQSAQDEVFTVFGAGAGAAENRQTRTKTSTGVVVASDPIILAFLD